MRSRPPVAPAASAVLLSLALSACGGHSTGGRPAPSGSATDLPSVAAKAGPEHFIRRWAAAETRMEHTGRTAPYLALSTGCQDCRTLAHAIARYYADGGYMVGGAWQIDAIAVTPSGGGDLVKVEAYAEASRIKPSASEPVERLKRRRTDLYVRVEPAGHSFTVTARTQD
jgi:hypothetical protein